MKRRLTGLVVLYVFIFAAVPLVMAATDPRYNALEARVTSLEQRVSALEAQASPSPTPTAAPTPTPSPTSTPSPTATPTPAPTATPSPTSTPQPPTPTPVPPSRRFSLPATTQTFTIPTSIDSTGATDVSAAVQSWVNGVPNGSILSFRPGTYRIDRALSLINRSNLIVDGAGATIKTNGGVNISDSAFVLDGGNSHITIRNFTLDGDNPNVGTPNAYTFGQEAAEGVAVYHDESYIELANLTITDQWGHGIYFGTNGDAAESGRNIWIHDNTVDGTGLYGIVFAKVDTAWVENNALLDVGGSPLGFEDGGAGEGIRHVLLSRNTITRWSWEDNYTPHAMVGDGETGMVWDDITIDSNVLTTGPMLPNSNYGPQAGWISFWGSDSHTNIRITNNSSPAAVNGWAVRLNNAPGAIVQGNNFPGGQYVCSGSCSGASIQ